jgi:hypothetical protein
VKCVPVSVNEVMMSELFSNNNPVIWGVSSLNHNAKNDEVGPKA